MKWSDYVATLYNESSRIKEAKDAREELVKKVLDYGVIYPLYIIVSVTFVVVIAYK